MPLHQPVSLGNASRKRVLMPNFGSIRGVVRWSRGEVLMMLRMMALLLMDGAGVADSR
jgi:hypothetical protein